MKAGHIACTRHLSPLPLKRSSSSISRKTLNRLPERDRISPETALFPKQIRGPLVLWLATVIAEKGE